MSSGHIGFADPRIQEQDEMWALYVGSALFCCLQRCLVEDRDEADRYTFLSSYRLDGSKDGEALDSKTKERDVMLC
jgi:hypothetical protein